MKLAKPLLITAAVIVLAAALTYALLHKPLAPAVTFTTLEGETIELDDLRGKVVLVNFWATSCGACVAEMPDMIEVYREYHDRGFEIVAVAMGYDPPNHVLSFAQTRQLPFPVALDVDGAHARAFGNVRATPPSSSAGTARCLNTRLACSISPGCGRCSTRSCRVAGANRDPADAGAVRVRD